MYCDCKKRQIFTTHPSADFYNTPISVGKNVDVSIPLQCHIVRTAGIELRVTPSDGPICTDVYRIIPLLIPPPLSPCPLGCTI